MNRAMEAKIAPIAVILSRNTLGEVAEVGETGFPRAKFPGIQGKPVRARFSESTPAY
jgi:hypothetical protein